MTAQIATYDWLTRDPRGGCGPPCPGVSRRKPLDDEIPFG